MSFGRLQGEYCGWRIGVEKSSAELAGKKFYSKYPNRRLLRELVSLILSGVAAIDEELKQFSSSYGDKSAALQGQAQEGGGI
jgi:V-type H+-transporting ATPase subunit C